MAEQTTTGPAGQWRLSLRQAVRQSWLIHPDWSVDDHLGWLDEEGYDISRLPDDPAAIVGGWLAEYRRAATLPRLVEGSVYVVAGADMIAVFDDPEKAGIQRAVMQAAGLDPIVRTLTTAEWETAAALIRIANPAQVISDTRHGHPDGRS